MATAQDFLILIVDDKPANLFALEQVLRGVPARTMRAASGDEALALCLRHRFAVALLDVQMPGMDGYELAELLLGNPSTASMPIIFLSAAYQDEAHRLRGYTTGAVDYLVKPLDPTILLGKVRVFLELARVRDELEGLVRERTMALHAKAAVIQRRNGFRALIADVAGSLGRCHANDLDAALTGALRRVAGTIGASHGFVRIAGGTDVPAVAVEWFAGSAPEGRTSFTPEMLGLAAMQRGEAFAGPAVAADDDPAIRAGFESAGAASVLLFPLREGSVVEGAVGFDWRAPPAFDVEDLPELLALLPGMIHGTARRAAAELAQRASQERHRALFEHTPLGVVYQDASGRIVAANPAAERILGVVPGVLPDAVADPRCLPVREDGTTLPGAEHPAMVALRTGREVHGVALGVPHPRSAERRWFVVDAVPVFSGDATAPSEVFSTFSDVTELRRAAAERERLVQVEAESRAKGQFLASMSHEIRTPMNAVLGYTQLLLREAGMTPRQREYLETIDRSGDHLLGLINNVLDMARIEAGGYTLDATPADLDDLLLDLERMFRLRASEKKLALRVVGPGLLRDRLLLDAGKVRQVLINLVGNAMKFTPAGGITVRAKVTELGDGRASVSVDVEDTGIGIAPERLDDVFAPFVQVAPGAARTGTGLGLAVSRRFARLMGGDLSATSHTGIGTTFRFAFEASWAQEGRPAREAPRVVGVEGVSRPPVLVVEGDAGARLMLTRMLEAVGLPVRNAATLAEATAALGKESCAMVLSAERLSDGRGPQIVCALRAVPGHERVPVTLVSASALDTDATMADGHLEKPVREAALFDEIARRTGVRFRHAGVVADADDGDALGPEDVRALPPDGRATLVSALQRGYLDDIGAALEALEPHAPRHTVLRLRELAGRFEYGALVDLLASNAGAS